MHHKPRRLPPLTKKANPPNISKNLNEGTSSSLQLDVDISLEYYTGDLTVDNSCNVYVYSSSTC